MRRGAVPKGPGGISLLKKGAPPMTRRHALATLAAACHLILVVCGASSLVFSSPPSEDDFARQTVRLYGALSGSDNGYGFFAPGVGPQVRATFTLRDASGET